ncbi:MAG: serine/threonine protein kinase [Elusimicrobia bacterium]|nr:serine/threonine protein kinase [Elusimicrobiota bacterium]
MSTVTLLALAPFAALALAIDPPAMQPAGNSHPAALDLSQATPGDPHHGPAHPKTPKEFLRIIKGAIDHAEGDLRELEKHERSYREASSRTPWAIKRLAVQREPVRARVKEVLERVTGLEDEFVERQRESTMLRGARIYAQVMPSGVAKDLEKQDLKANEMLAEIAKRLQSGAAGPAPANSAELLLEGSEMLNDAKIFNAFAKEIRVWREGAAARLASEDAAFGMAEHSVLIEEIFAGASLLCLVFGLGALRLWMKTEQAKSRLETDISKIASGSGQLGVDGGRTTTGEAMPAATVLAGNFVIERELGRGGMGIVFEATDLSLRRKVAIKQLRQEIQEQVQEVEVLLNEARMVAKLKHPNIVEIHTVFREKGQVYLVFEYVTGETLHRVISTNKRLTLKHARTLLQQIAAALDYAHSQRIIHRDLKPANVIVTHEGVVKVMDFGIAHQAKATVARMTQSQPWGTPPYMAPEQETGQVSRESDLYGLGVFLYEMTTGQLPFNGPNFLAQKTALMCKAPSALNPSLPAGFDALIQRALQPSPANRFHSAAEMIAALSALPDASPVS